jgi:hypothetical protein
VCISGEVGMLDIVRNPARAQQWAVGRSDFAPRAGPNGQLDAYDGQPGPQLPPPSALSRRDGPKLPSVWRAFYQEGLKAPWY